MRLSAAVDGEPVAADGEPATAAADGACCGMCGGGDDPPPLRPPMSTRPAPPPHRLVALRHASLSGPVAVRLPAGGAQPLPATPSPRQAPPGPASTDAAGPAAPAPSGPLLALDRRGSATRTRAARLDRNADRRITAAGLVVAAVFLAVALAVVVVPGTSPGGWWLPLHLVLAGAASTAIAAVMPFFSSALVAAPPARPSVRVASLALIAAGATLVAGRSIDPSSLLPAAGGVAFLAGAGLLGWATLAPLRGALGTSRPLVATAYAVAIADVAAGALLATLFVAGWIPVLERWAYLKPAHAWLNLLGFVSLVIAGTLLHLLPTVLGGRIVPRRSAVVAVGGLAAGAPLVALGYTIAGEPGPAGDLAARVGALAALAGAAALSWHAGEVLRARGRWSTDAGWHRMASVGLVAAVGWFAVAVAIAAGRVAVLGAAPDAWRLAAVIAPLAVGWVVQALIAAWTHLLPSIGPGGPAEHARQRALLGRFATPRLALLNGGTALLALGLPSASPDIVRIGGVLVALAVGASLGLAALAVAQVRRGRRPAGG